MACQYGIGLTIGRICSGSLGFDISTRAIIEGRDMKKFLTTMMAVVAASVNADGLTPVQLQDLDITNKIYTAAQVDEIAEAGGDFTTNNVLLVDTITNVVSALGGRMSTNDVCNIVTNEVEESYWTYSPDIPDDSKPMFYHDGMWELSNGWGMKTGEEDALTVSFDEADWGGDYAFTATRHRVTRNALGLATLEDLPPLTNGIPTRTDIEAGWWSEWDVSPSDVELRWTDNPAESIIGWSPYKNGVEWGSAKGDADSSSLSWAEGSEASEYITATRYRVAAPIPDKVSQLANDSGYVTKSVTNGLATMVRHVDEMESSEWLLLGNNCLLSWEPEEGEWHGSYSDKGNTTRCVLRYDGEWLYKSWVFRLGATVPDWQYTNTAIRTASELTFGNNNLVRTNETWATIDYPVVYANDLPPLTNGLVSHSELEGILDVELSKKLSPYPFIESEVMETWDYAGVAAGEGYHWEIEVNTVSYEYALYKVANGADTSSGTLYGIYNGTEDTVYIPDFLEPDGMAQYVGVSATRSRICPLAPFKNNQMNLGWKFTSGGENVVSGPTYSNGAWTVDVVFEGYSDRFTAAETAEDATSLTFSGGLVTATRLPSAFTVTVSASTVTNTMRDLWFVLKCSESAPNITWGSNIDRFDGGSAGAIAPTANATNVYHIVEYEKGRFYVATQQRSSASMVAQIATNAADIVSITNNLATNYKTKADLDKGWLSEWTILRDGNDVTSQVGQPEFNSEWDVSGAIVRGDQEPSGVVPPIDEDTMTLSWMTEYQGQEDMETAHYTATRYRVAAPIPDKVSQLINDANYVTKSVTNGLAALNKIPLPSNEQPRQDGLGYSGVSNTWARSDHVHPTDTSRASQQDLEDNYYNRAQTENAINLLAAYYITMDAEGSPFTTLFALTNASTYYSGGEARELTRNDYAVVLEDESHNTNEWRYVYATHVDAGTGETNGQWEAQYPIETNDYGALSNKPQIDGVELTENTTAAQLGLVTATDVNNLDTSYRRFIGITNVNQSIQYFTTTENDGITELRIEIPADGVTKDWVVYVISAKELTLTLPDNTTWWMASTSYLDNIASNTPTALYFTQVTDGKYMLGRQELHEVSIPLPVVTEPETTEEEPEEETP